MSEHLQSTDHTEKEISDIVSLGKIAIGDILTVLYEGDPEPAVYILAAKHTIGDIDSPMPTISLESPLGKAVHSAKTGDKITFDTPDGATSVTILNAQPGPVK